ncbi:MAG: nitroreductase [Steroidobacteraceae bacterium]
MIVSDAVRSRRSIRAFLSRPVERHTIEAILDAARFAPSGSNIQPWQVHVVTGAARDALAARASEAMRNGTQGSRDWNYYGDVIPEPYLARRRNCGWGLYGHLGVQKGDRTASGEHALRNFSFFGAPVGLFFFIDRKLALGSWVDYGIFLGEFMLLAREHGLATCAQAAWLQAHEIVRAQLGVGPEHALVCGMSMGYADADAHVNAYQPARLAITDFVQFHDLASAP